MPQAGTSFAAPDLNPDFFFLTINVEQTKILKKEGGGGGSGGGEDRKQVRSSSVLSVKRVGSVPVG